jgi:hypothetical protein
MVLEPKFFDNLDQAITFVEKRMKAEEDEGDEKLVLQWRRDELYPNSYSNYTREQLLEEYTKTGEIILQLTSAEGLAYDRVAGEIANIMTEEKHNKENQEAQVALDKIGQELADGYNTTISIGMEGKTFKPAKKRSKKSKKT